MLRVFSISIILLFSVTIANAQDPRISQYQQMPLLLNPANTGNYNGKTRIGGFYNQMRKDSLTNRCSNFSAEFNLGEGSKWAFGLNAMTSGSSKFAMSGTYVGLSLVKAINFNESNEHLLRIGAQASFISGSFQKSKGNYDPILDVRAFNIQRDFASIDSNLYKKNYINLNAGVNYKHSGPLFDFETGVAIFNLSHPDDDILSAGTGVRKRFRLTLNSSLRFNINEMNAVKLQQISWQEGLFVRYAPVSKTDSLQIHETLYGLNWERLGVGTQYSLGMFLRSAKSMTAVVGVSLIPELTTRFSYEFPINKKYYSISQFGISLVYQDISFD
jgi:type IX secretion system PorP/SprF family membrane protein